MSDEIKEPPYDKLERYEHAAEEAFWVAEALLGVKWLVAELRRVNSARLELVKEKGQLLEERMRLAELLGSACYAPEVLGRVEALIDERNALRLRLSDLPAVEVPE